MNWFFFVNPFRRDEDSQAMQDLLTGVGLTRSRQASPVTPRPAGLDIAGNVFRREGTIWTVAFEGSGARLTELKGFHDIARLLARPRGAIHCLDLVGASLESYSAAGEVLDPAARGAYHERIRELQGELEAAEARHDIGRVERVRTELDTLVEILAKAMGLGGRSRKLGDPAERARSAITWRIRSAIKNIQAAHPRLGSHLTNAIRTGTFCVYNPETDLSWQV